MRIPLYIEFEGKKVLVIGGGGVGTSRAKKFLNAGARVRVLSLEFSDELRNLEREGKVELIRGDAFDEGLLEENISWADLVVVAIGNLAINDRVIQLARKHKVLVNLANDADRTEVVVPFETSVDGLRVAITSEGKSGIVVRKALRKIEDVLRKDKSLFVELELLWYLKRRMKELGVPVNVRMGAYFEIEKDPEFRKFVEEGRIEEGKAWLEERIREYSSGKRVPDRSKTRISF